MHRAGVERCQTLQCGMYQHLTNAVTKYLFCYVQEDLPLMHALRSQLARVASAARSGQGLHSIVLQGAGAHFCTGGAQHRDAGMQLVPSSALAAATSDMGDAVMMLQQIEAPVLNVLHGKLIGGGVALALNTDWRVCTFAASFNHGNLSRNMNPITDFSRTFGNTVGAGLAIAVYMNNAQISVNDALSSGLVDSAEADPQTARVQAAKVAARLNCRKLVRHGLSDADTRFLATEDALNACVVRQNITLASHGSHPALHSKGVQPVQTGLYQLVGDQKLCFRAVPIEAPITIATGHALVQMSAYGLNFRYVYLFGASSMLSKCVCLFAPGESTHRALAQYHASVQR